jgi:ADP-ribosylglycohydrolase
MDRVTGAVVGSAVGDALGAPFEFGPPGALGRGAEMAAGGGWDPGEATDDTQMAVHLAESLLDQGLDLADIFARFQRWACGEPKDIGLQTEIVLTSGLPWDQAAADHAKFNKHSAGNGCLMRATTSAVYFAGRGRVATMDAARRIAALTHGDPAAWEATAIFHDLIRVALDGADPLAALPDTLAAVAPEHRDEYERFLAPGWDPATATQFNGAVWSCLGCAVWALRTTGTFADAVRAAVNLGGDTDTVGAVTGGLAGAVYGAEAIPEHWTAPLFVPLPGTGRTLRLAELKELAHGLSLAANRKPVDRRAGGQ